MVDIEVKTINNNTIKINISREIIKIYLDKITSINKMDIYAISDINIINCLIGIYYKNGIILNTLINKIDNIHKDIFYLCNKIDYIGINKIKGHFISPENLIKKFNYLLDKCNNFMSIIENNSVMINNIDSKIITIQNKNRMNNIIDYIKDFRQTLLIRDLIHFITADMFNDINYIYLQAITLKYDLMMVEDNLIEKFIKLEELETEFNRIKVPYCFIDKQNKINKIDFNLTNGNIDIISVINSIIKTIDNENNIKYFN